MTNRLTHTVPASTQPQRRAQTHRRAQGAGPAMFALGCWPKGRLFVDPCLCIGTGLFVDPCLCIGTGLCTGLNREVSKPAGGGDRYDFQEISA